MNDVSIRKLIALLAIAVASTLAGSSARCADTHQPKSDRPNVVFFIADDMLPHHFNCLAEGKGRNLTPNLDRLAGEGVVMVNQYCASPICTPSRYNVLTGTYASRATNPAFLQTTQNNGGQTKVEFNTHIMKDTPTLPRMLKRAGYETAMVGKNHVVEVAGLETFPDFDASAKAPENITRLKANHDKVCQAIREIGFDYVDRVYHNNPHFLGLHEVAVQNMEWITEGAINFLDQDHDRPFFLYMATTVPHGPTNGPQSWNADPLISPLGYLDRAPDVQPARQTIPERIRQAGLSVNDDTCNLLWLDDAVGALIKKLEQTNQLQNTVFFFYSDHGQKAKGTLYEGGVHNPSIVWRPGGFPVGSTSDALVHVVDFAPTIVQIAGVDPSTGSFDGESFLGYLNGTPATSDRVLYFELGYTRAVRKGSWKYLAVRYPADIENMSMEQRKRTLENWNAARRRRHVRIVTEDPSLPFSHLTAIPGGGDAESGSTGSLPGYYDRDQLYNLDDDPGEQNNLAGAPEYAEKLREMKQILNAHVLRLPGTFGEFGK
ncbi:sulfatase family protein [Crateriforma conspicua]|uniref:sulfatase family protein n=1 Tax=Crateriforma conspicua TaxID=2527996 RepID=UPI00118A5698|nr:sulfatase-like hydrolase/transferase [Crateriforma conspicua]QDV63460.1 Arylsulfatase [Crateriforma conspicua]